MELNGMKPMSHYDFRVAVVLAKISPEKHGAKKQKKSIAVQKGEYRAANRMSGSTRKRKDDETVTTRGTEDESNKSKRAKYFSSGQIDNPGSEINMTRMNEDLRHLPVPADRTRSNGVACTLCRWATGIKHASQLLKCNDCGFNLCAWCYEPFHSVPIFNTEFQHGLCMEIEARQPKNPKKGKNIVKVNGKASAKKAAKSKRKS